MKAALANDCPEPTARNTAVITFRAFAMSPCFGIIVMHSAAALPGAAYHTAQHLADQRREAAGPTESMTLACTAEETKRIE